MPGRTLLFLESIIPFGIAGLLFGLLYNTLFYPWTLVEYTEAGTIGVLVGLAVGVIEQHPGLKRWLQRRSLGQSVVVRTLAYSVIVALALSFVLSIEPATLGECAYGDCLVEYLRGPLFARDLVFSTAFVFIAALIAEIVLLVGTRNVGRMITGRYRRPREVRAEFLFVDLRGSTTTAEKLGNERYSAMLREFFIDVSGAIYQTGGEVYQYVGDEVVVVWPGTRAAGAWLSCFRLMQSAIASQRAVYEADFGLFPGFKAGVHAGTVVVTEVGVLQRAFVYHGDVLNTAARVQAMCNEAGFDLLATREAVESLDEGDRAGFESLGPFALRGKAGPVEVFALTAARTASHP